MNCNLCEQSMIADFLYLKQKELVSKTLYSSIQKNEYYFIIISDEKNSFCNPCHYGRYGNH